MPLKSRLFSGDQALAACLVQDSAHVTPGAVGEHVSKIHTALLAIDNLAVAAQELKTKSYGSTTAAAVLAFKQRRKIVNPAYQKTADNIVGKMTIDALDKAMVTVESGLGGPVDPGSKPAVT